MSTLSLGPVAASSRINAIDVARGFALLGILAVNIKFYAEPFGQVMRLAPPEGVAVADDHVLEAPADAAERVKAERRRRVVAPAGTRWALGTTMAPRFARSPSDAARASVTLRVDPPGAVRVEASMSGQSCPGGAMRRPANPTESP